MKRFRFPLSILVFVTFLFVTSCTHTHGQDSVSVELLRGQEFTSYRHEHIGSHIFVSVQGTSSAARLAKVIEEEVKKRGFSRTRTPSSADLILQITVAYAGHASLSDLAGAVAEGYDQTVHVGGREGFGMVVDALLVARAVPEADTDHKTKLENISHRQALGSSMVRMGAYVAGDYHTRTLPRPFIEALARELCAKVQRAQR